MSVLIWLKCIRLLLLVLGHCCHDCISASCCLPNYIWHRVDHKSMKGEPGHEWIRLVCSWSDSCFRLPSCRFLRRTTCPAPCCNSSSALLYHPEPGSKVFWSKRQAHIDELSCLIRTLQRRRPLDPSLQMTLSPENGPIPAVCWHWPFAPAEEMMVVVTLRKIGLGTPANNPTVSIVYF
jgi:hypothetical protein